MKMWNSVYAKQIGWKILHGMCNYCIQRHVSVGLCRRNIHVEHRCCGPTPEQTEPVVVNFSTAGPPWRVLFLGSDDFAVESLKLLSNSRKSNDGLLRSLEVVTLANDVPVKKFAEENELPIHTWPLGDLQGRFDVGVVVSFGCLLRERLIKQFPYGILNVHPSLLPRWRGPAPVFHTVLHGDTLTGVTVMQIRPKRFDVGPILHQGTYQIPENCTADQLGAALANQGAGLLLDTLKNLPERILNKREQAREGETLAPKILPSMSWLQWEDQSCLQIERLYRAISSRVPLRTVWMGKTVKLLDFVGPCSISLSGRGLTPVPGCISYQKELDTLAVRCKDGWVGFRSVVLKKRLSATDFYNGYLHQSFSSGDSLQSQESMFMSNKDRAEPISEENSVNHQRTVH